MNIRTYLLAVGAGLLMMNACSDPHALPENVIPSAEGLQINLEWTTGSGVEAAIDEADLDLRLMRGTETVGRSEHVTRFESLRMQKTLSDGEFRIDIRAHKVKKRADFTVTISDMENLKSKVYDSYFMVGEDISLEYLRIVKEGENYTVTPL